MRCKSNESVENEIKMQNSPLPVLYKGVLSQMLGVEWGCCCCLVTKSCLILCDPMDCSMPGFSVLYYLPEFAQTHVHWVSDDIQPSHAIQHETMDVTSFSSCRLSFPSSGSFPMSWLFASASHSIGALASASVLPMNIQSWGLISFRTDWLILL